MGRDKHEPKDSKQKFQISDDAEKTLIGLMLVIISLIGLFNRGFVGKFLTYIFVYVFGAFYFIFFFFLIFFGIYLVIKKKGLSLKVNLNFLGVTLLFVSALITACIQEDSLTIRNTFSIYQSRIGSISSGIFSIESLSNVGVTGGGFVGYFLTGLLNSAVTSLGTKIIVACFIVAGAFILLKKPLTFVIKGIKKSVTARKEKKKQQKELQQLAAQTSEESASDRTITIPNVQKEEIDVPQSEPRKPAPTNNSPFSIKTASRPSAPTFQNAYKPEQTQVEERTIQPIIEEPVSKPIEKQDYLIDEKELQGDAPVINNSEADNHHSNPFLNIFSKPKEKAEENNIKEEEISKPVVNNAKEKIELDDDSEDLKDGLTIERSDRKIVSPLDKSYNMSQQQTSFNQNQNLFVTKNVDTEPKKVVQPSVQRKYILPSITLLSDHKEYGKFEQNQRAAQDRVGMINSVFDNFKVKASVVSYIIGPSVTRFNVKTEPGVRVSTLAGLVNEIQVGLQGDKSVRIETVVQGQDTSGIEVGNPVPMTVPFKKCFDALSGEDKLVIPLGEGINGNIIKVALSDFPHVLIAGSTGSGKSVFVHSLIMSLIMRNYPNELKLIMVDPKKVEFTKYQNLPHLYCPIITEPDIATAALYKLVSEMERRYTVLSRNEVVNVKEYRKLMASKPDLEEMPNIVMIIDEFADLISNNAKEIEPLIQRIAQKARAAGIFMVIATQRPSVNVITGDIKANIPGRIALSVSSAIDSRTILDETGAETLLGKGDLLARIPGLKFLTRVQSAYVDNEEISRVVKYLKEQDKPNFNPDFLNLELREDQNGNLSPANDKSILGGKKGSDDEYYETIRQYVLDSQTASTSSIMRHFGLGYGRAASILDSLEEEGIVKTIGNGRKVVIKKTDGADSDF